MILFCVNPDLFFHVAAPAVDATHTPHGPAEGHHRAGGDGQLLPVGGLLQLLWGVGEGGEGKGLVQHFQGQAGAPIPQHHRMGVHMAAALLGDQVGGDMGRLPVPAEDAAFFPVWVGLPGQSQPLHLLHRLRRSEAQAEQGQARPVWPAVIVDVYR